MTGNPYRKTRVYLSDRLYSPLAQRKNFDEAIAEFKKSVSFSMAQSRLNADIAVKAMPATQGNTDGKKRTNTGQTPGVTDIDGIRFKPNEKGGEGKIFKWIPSIHDRMNPSRNSVNFGWMSPDDMGNKNQKRTKPEVRVRKYRINPKTNEAIDGSEERINPYNLASDEPLEKGLEFKKLPGRSILNSVPGGTLAGRAAARFGIWIDEFNKMRCPPGTPAANQFTDATGSNCFGLSPSGLVNIAQEVIKRSDIEVLDQISNRLAAKDPARNGLSSGRVQNDPWWKNHWGARKSNQKNAGNGYKLDIDPRTISVAETPSQFRWFVTGAKRAQNGMEASKKRVGKLVQSLGVDATPEEMATNAHLFRAIDELSARGMLDLQIGAPSDFSGTAVGRPSYEQVRSHIIQKLSGTSASWNDLSDTQKEKIIQADIERYYEIERQMVEAFLDAYVQMPEHMKNIKYLSYSNPNNRKDEAEAYSLGENFEESMIKIDIITIMDNQEKMLPSMDEYHKLRIDAINGSDAENAQEMADFLVSSQIEARRTAAMAMGHEAFARHIMYHEIGHTVQIAAVGRELKRRGMLPKDAKNELIANVIMDILGNPNNNFLESWNGILTKTEAVKFLAGSYPTAVERADGRTLGLVEAQAELFALRMSGLIWGDDIDNALGYMDDIADGRFAEDRLGFQEMEQSVFDAAAVGDIPVAPSAIYKMALDDARRRRIDENRKITEQRRIEQINDNAKNDDEDTLIQRLTDIEAELADPSIGDNRKEQLLSEKRKYRQAVTKRRRDSGDESTQQRISRYIDKRVEKELIDSGRKEEQKKKPKAFKGSKDAEEHAISERSRLLQKATPQEREAILQMSDPEAVDVGQLLNPKAQVRAAKAINKRNRRATRNGNEVDESSREVGSLAGQVENILIPSLDLIDKSELDEAVEIETELELDAKQLKAAKDADDIVVDSLIRGRVVTSSKPFSGGAESKNPETGGKTKTKVVVRAQKGQKGYFPHWSDETSTKPKDYDQQMVMPSGKLRIVERRIDKDGNEVLVAEVVHQDDAMKSLNSMMDAIGIEGPESTQHAKGTRKKLEKVVNAYATRRAREGRYASTVTPQAKSESIKKRNIEVSADIKDAGGDGQSGLSAQKAKEASSVVNGDGTDSIFGPVEAKEDRTQTREEKHLSVISSLRDLISFGGSDDELEIDSDDISPEVRQLIETSTDEELMGYVSDQAQKFHESLDKRPRLRFWDEQLNKFIADPRFGVKSPESIDEQENSRSLADVIRDGMRALDTPETRELLSNVSKATARKLVSEELQYMVDDGTLDPETAEKLLGILDELIPERDGEFDPLLAINAVKSVLAKRKAESQLRGLSSGALASTAQSLMTVWDTWNAADPDNLQLSQDVISNIAMLTNSDNITIQDMVSNLVKRLRTGSAVKSHGEEYPYETGNLKKAQDLVNISMLLMGAKYDDVKKWGQQRISSLGALSRSRRERRKGIESGAKKVSASGEEIFKTASIDEALQLISEGKLVELDSVERVATMIDKLNEIVKDAKEKGEKAPNYDLCKVSVPGTNLFCADSKGIPRIQMPQFSGEPVEGSKADKLPKNKNGEVDATLEFEKHLESLGVKVEKKTVKASELKATQNELVGSKVAGMITNTDFDPAGEAIFVSRDGYVIDGHHRWAAQVGRDLTDGQLGDLDLQVRVVDMPITEILRESNNWAQEFGIAPKSGKEVTAPAKEKTREITGAAKDLTKKTSPEMDRAANRYGAGSASVPEPRSPGLKDNRDRSVREYGMEWRPEYTDNQTVETAKEWGGWDDVEATSIDLSEDILPTESHLKGSSIDKVVSGEEPFREGYDPHLLIDENGQIFVIDGHNRVAMHRALGNSRMNAKIIDLRKEKAPWGERELVSSGARSGLSSGKRNYGGYDLDAPDNPEPKPGEFPDDVVDAAREHRDAIAEVEKEMTETLIDLANKHGGKMEGLAFRLKALKSLARKIFAEKDEEHGGDAKKAAESMSDVVRYTMTYNPESYVDGVKGVVEDLQKQGYKLRIKNYWEGGDPYQGINVAAEHPNGTKFELQFHTPQSIEIKEEEIHKLYEDYRTENDPRKRFKLYDAMTRLAKKIEVPYPPDELLEIGTRKRQDFSVKHLKSFVERKVLVKL